MKIEIGESLIYSWLRHVNGCQIAQANWKASLDSWQMDNVDELNKLMSDWAEWFDVKYEAKVFKRTSSLKQLLRQAEIDVLGIKFADASQHLYAVDIAVHGGGLNYGDKRETAARVAKKMLRSAMCLHAYLPGYQGDIILASPYITRATLAPIEEYIADVQALMHKAELPYTVSVLANDCFLERILQPVMDMSRSLEDTTELFVRSVKLYERFFPRFDGKVSGHRTPAEKIPAKTDRSPPEQKIGAYVKATLPDLLTSGKVPEGEIKRLQTKEYSKGTLGINYPLLRKRLADNEKRPNRYWASPVVEVNGDSFFICCEWYEGMRSRYDAWLRKLGSS